MSTVSCYGMLSLESNGGMLQDYPYRNRPSPSEYTFVRRVDGHWSADATTKEVRMLGRCKGAFNISVLSLTGSHMIAVPATKSAFSHRPLASQTSMLSSRTDKDRRAQVHNGSMNDYHFFSCLTAFCIAGTGSASLPIPVAQRRQSL